MSAKYLLLLDDSFGGTPLPPTEHNLLTTKDETLFTTKSGVFITARQVNVGRVNDKQKTII